MSTIQRLKELEAKATPGEWYGRRSLFGDIINIHGDKQCVVGSASIEDAELIIAMKNVLPKLLAVIQAVQDTLCIETPKQVLDALAALDEEPG